MLSGISKFSINLGWTLIVKALQNLLSSSGLSDLARKVANQLLSTGGKSIAILTNNNPNDSEEFKTLMKTQEKESALLGLEIAEKLIVNNVKDELALLLVLTSLQEVRKAIEAEDFSQITSNAIIDNLPKNDTDLLPPKL